MRTWLLWNVALGVGGVLQPSWSKMPSSISRCVPSTTSIMLVLKGGRLFLLKTVAARSVPKFSLPPICNDNHCQSATPATCHEVSFQMKCCSRSSPKMFRNFIKEVQYCTFSLYQRAVINKKEQGFTTFQKLDYSKPCESQCPARYVC